MKPNLSASLSANVDEYLRKIAAIRARVAAQQRAVAADPATLHLGNRAYIKAYYDRMDKAGKSTGD